MIGTICKVIGMVILAVIGLLLLVLLLLLSLPIRYRFSGSYYDVLQGTVDVRWFPLGFRVELVYKDNRLAYVVKLFGGVVFTNTERKLSLLGRKLSAADSKEEQEDLGVTYEEEKTEPNFKIFSEGEKEASVKEEPAAKKTPKRLSIWERIQSGFDGWVDWCKKIGNKLKKIRDKKEMLLRIYHSKRFEVAMQDVTAYVKELCSIFRPRNLRGKVHYGFDDPATTGQATGILATALPLYDGFLTIFPDFENKCLEGELVGDGRIYLFPIVRLALKVFFNKNLIKVIKKVQTIIEA